MLFERWKEVVRENSRDFALCDFASGTRWTFAALDREAEKVSPPRETIHSAQGNSWRLIVELLAAWRNGNVTCPLEQGQVLPQFLELPRECAHLKVTSATSGPPKIIAFTGPQLNADVENITATMGLRKEWPNIAAISLAHSYGFSNLVLPLVLKGIPLIILPAPLPETMRSALGEWKSVTVPAVPALWRTWLQSGVIGPSIKLAISAGAPLPIELEQEIFKRHTLKIHNFYGSSECGGIAYDRRLVPRKDGAIAGQAMEGVDLSLTDEGLLVVKSQAVGLGYLPGTSATLGNGRFETSDLAEIRQGDVILKGRMGESINVAGRKISPESIEAVLRRHPAVKECVVFGVASQEAERTENIVACIQGDVREGELKRFLTEHLAGWQVPREFWFVEEIAVNARGKISRAAWREKYLQERSGRQVSNRSVD